LFYPVLTVLESPFSICVGFSNERKHFFSFSKEKGFYRLVRLQNTNGTLYPTDLLVCNDDRPASHSP